MLMTAAPLLCVPYRKGFLIVNTCILQNLSDFGFPVILMFNIKVYSYVVFWVDLFKLWFNVQVNHNSVTSRRSLFSRLEIQDTQSHPTNTAEPVRPQYVAQCYT